MANNYSIFTYNPKDVILSVGGYQIVGWQSISISRSVEGIQVIKGIRGKNTRVPNEDTSATIMISLLQTVQGNDVLSAIHEADLVTGTARLALTLRDKSGRSVFSTDEGFITGYPTATFDAGFQYRQWKIFCQTTSGYIVGGNAKPKSDLLDAAVQGVGNFVEGLL